jgi:hypothetical protein
MNHANEVGSGAILYISSFIKIRSGIQKLRGGGVNRHTDTQMNNQDGDRISLLLFFQNKESRLKI